MALIPITVYGNPFTSTESTFLKNFADLTVVQGDIYYVNSSLQVAVLAPGNNGQVLASQGAAANPHWIDVAGTGTVTTVSVVSANGFAGTVANATTTPAITISTTITGLIKGNGTAISTATAGSDYAVGSIGLAGGQTIAGGTLTTQNLTLVANAADTTTGSITIATSTASTTKTTGALTVVGGLGVAGTINANALALTTGLPVSSGGTGGTSASITLFNNITGFTASGTTGTTSTNLVFSTSPSLTTPTLGVASATTINKVTITAPATGSTLTIADGKTLTVSNSGTLSGGDAFVLSIAAAKTLTVSNTLTFTGTDSSSVAFGAGGTVLYTVSTIPLTVGTTTIASGTSTRILYDNAGVLGEYTLTGSGTVVAMQTAPTFVTSATVPLVIGGSGTTGTQLTIKTTTGNGTTDALAIVGGNNGGTTFATFTTGALTIGTSGVFTTGTIELGAASDTTLSRSGAGVLAVEGVVIPSISSTNTITNKRMTRRLVTVNNPGATPTTNSDNVDIQNFTGCANAITSMTTNLSGTPVDGDLLEFRFLDNGTARGITWGASFAATTVALPTTTVISTVLRVLFEWSGSTWNCVAVA